MDKRLPIILHTVFNLFVMLGLVSLVHAAPVRVFSPVGSGGVWSNPNSWQPFGTPLPDEEIEIAAGKSCQADGPLSIHTPIRVLSGASLTVGAPFTVTAGGQISIFGTGKLNVQESDLRLVGNIVVSGTIGLSNNAYVTIQDRSIPVPFISGAGNFGLRFKGTNSISGIALLEIPNLENNGDLFLDGPVKVTHQLANTGNIRFGSASSLEVNGSFLQSTGAKFNIENRNFPLKMQLSGSQRWLNAGSFFSGSQGEITLNTVFEPAFLNTGVAQMSSSIFIQSGSGVLRNTGTLVFSQNQGLWFSGNEDFRIESPSSIELFILQVNKTAGGVRFIGPAPLIVKDQISVLAGELDLQGNPVVLKAGALFTGKITSIWGNLTGAGLVTQEQFIPGPSAGWYFVGPVGLNQTVASISDDFQTSGPFTGATIPAGADRSTLFTFDGANEPTGALAGEVLGWRIPLNGNLETGRGYRAYIRSDFFTGRRIMDFTGFLVKGDFNFPITFNSQGYGGGGWNFLSNPYPCPLDWNSDEWTRSDMSNALYIWNGEANQYGVFLKGSDPGDGINGVGPVIRAGQSFFVKATGINPVLKATEAAKTSENGAFLRTTVQSIPSLRFKAHSSDGNRDETLIRFSNYSNQNFDPMEDAEKWTASNFQIANESKDGIKCAIQTIPIPTGFGLVQIPIHLKSTQETTLLPVFRNRDLLPGTLYLADSKTGDYQILTDSVEITLPPNPTGEKRYNLVLNSGTGVESSFSAENHSRFALRSAGQKIEIDAFHPKSARVKFHLLDATGKQLEEIQTSLSGSMAFQFSSVLKPGVYLVQKTENSQVQTLRQVIWYMQRDQVLHE